MWYGVEVGVGEQLAKFALPESVGTASAREVESKSGSKSATWRNDQFHHCNDFIQRSATTHRDLISVMYFTSWSDSACTIGVSITADANAFTVIPAGNFFARFRSQQPWRRNKPAFQHYPLCQQNSTPWAPSNVKHGQRSHPVSATSYLSRIAGRSAASARGSLRRTRSPCLAAAVSYNA